MKKIFYSLITISLLFVSCDKDNSSDNPEDNITVGGVYIPYTRLVINPVETSININDSIHIFNRVDAYYSPYKTTTSNSNVFVVRVIDTTKAFNFVNFEIFTSYIKPESFFKKDSFAVENICIERNGVRENFDNINTYFYWDIVSFNNFRFSGKARLKIPNEITGRLNPNIFYPKQELEFEF